jgi:hypothetical protein
VTGELVAGFVVVLGVQLAGFLAVVLRMQVMSAGDVGVVRGFLVKPRRMRLGRGIVVPCGVAMVRGCVPVVVDLFLVGHGIVSLRFTDNPGIRG